MGQASLAEILSSLESKKKSVTWITAVFIALLALVVLAFVSWSRLSARQSQLEQSTAAVTNMAYATAEHASNIITLADSIIAGLVERVEYEGIGRAVRPRLHRVMRMRVEQTRALQGLFIHDERGNWKVNSRIETATGLNYSDRDYFRFHRSNPDRGPHVGGPVISRSSGEWILPVSRRLQHPDGSFAGVVVATIKLDYFKRFYGRLDIGKHGSIFMALDKGELVVRRPFDQRHIGSDIRQGPVFKLMQQHGPSGTMMAVPRIDGIERLYSYRRLQGYPLLVSVALSKDEIFAPWRDDTWREGIAVLCVVVFVCFTGARLRRQLVVREVLESELRRAQTALEASNVSLTGLALTDSLTRLSNRRYFDQQLEIEFARAMRTEKPLSLLMIDVDFFKSYNDTYGHAAGDTCLQAVSRAVSAGKRRAGDVAARFGGEEFALLLPETSLEGALGVAEAVRQAIQAGLIPHAGSAQKVVTASVGVYAMIPVKGQTPRDLIERADRGLYMAKAEGRNRLGAAAV